MESQEISSSSFLLVFNSEISVKNKNLVDVTLNPTTATVLYNGTEVGKFPIRGQTIKSLLSTKFKIMLYADSDHYFYNISSNFHDVDHELIIHGIEVPKNLSFVAYAKFKAEPTKPLDYLEQRLVEMNCSFVVDTATKKIDPLSCN